MFQNPSAQMPIQSQFRWTNLFFESWKFFKRRCSIAAIFLLLGIPAYAETLSSNRWLLIVDTSLSMSSRDKATVDAAQAMLLSGMNGQLRPGDTIGVWTFNESLVTGRFPLQVWRPDRARLIATRLAQFLKTLQYKKSTRFDVVLPSVNRLVAESDILTVIFLTDGDEKIYGTPFDKQINAVFKKNFKSQKKSRKPFIIALRAEKGNLIGYTVTPAPALPTFPPMPLAQTQIIEKPLEKVEPAKSEIKSAPLPITEAPTNLVLAPNASEIKTAPTNSISSVPPIEMPRESTNAITVMVAEPAPATEALVISPNMERPKITEAPTPIVPEEITNSSLAPTTSALPEKLPLSSAEKSPLSTEQTVDQQTTQPKVASSEHPIVKPPQSMIAVSNKPALVQSAIVTRPTDNNQTRLFIGIGLIFIALGIGVFWMRRPRANTEGSLITRSIDKEKK